MGLKLFVDDTRPQPKGFECVTIYADAVLYYELFSEFEFVSLDYHLGEEHTGLDILKWMKEHGKVIKQGYRLRYDYLPLVDFFFPAK